MNTAARRHRSGISMAEALISLVIVSLLLTATAVAFRASAAGVNENDEFFRATQAARVTLNRILTQVRAGTVDTASTASNLHLITGSSQDVRYIYNSGASTVTYTAASSTYTLARNVSSASFAYSTGTDSTGATAVTRVAMQITVSIGGNQILLSGAAAPRKSLASF